MPNEIICKNCGRCCGPVIINRKEREQIKKFLAKHPEVAKYAKDKPFSPMDCIFRNDQECKCMVYGARPKVCRIYTCTSRNWQNMQALSYKKGFFFINAEFGSPEIRVQYGEEYKRIFSMLFIK